MTSPFSLLEFAPLDPTGADISRTADLANDGSGETITAEGIEAAKEAFLKACSRGEALKADHIFLWLWDHVPAIEAFDLLMSVALPKNALDDHYFLFPGYLWRGLETLGHGAPQGAVPPGGALRRALPRPARWCRRSMR